MGRRVKHYYLNRMTGQCKTYLEWLQLGYRGLDGAIKRNAKCRGVSFVKMTAEQAVREGYINKKEYEKSGYLDEPYGNKKKGDTK